MIVSPRYLLLDGEDQDNPAHPVAFKYSYRPAELAKKKTQAEPIVVFNCNIEESHGGISAAVLHILGFRPRAMYQVQCPLIKLNNERENMRNFVNEFLHAKYHNKPDMLVADSVYVSTISFSAKGENACEAEFRLCRSSDVKPWLLNAAIIEFFSSRMNIADAGLKLLSGEVRYGHAKFTDESAANSFKHAMNVQYSSKFELDQCAGGFFELEPNNGIRCIWVNVSCLKPMPVSQSELLTYFGNPNRSAFDVKVYGRSTKNYTEEQMRARDKAQTRLNSLCIDQVYEMHSREYMMRIRSNLDTGKFPAHNTLHLCDAEGRDDSNFAFGIPPFHYKDGTPNPLGIPDQLQIECNPHALT
tara:strand:+ start:5646 stop:6719 length:1074 start_codon:yes stop_codon:yes gene_type:complete